MFLTDSLIKREPDYFYRDLFTEQWSSVWGAGFAIQWPLV